MFKRAGLEQDGQEREDGLGSTQGKTNQAAPGIIWLRDRRRASSDGERSKHSGCLAWLHRLSTSPKTTQLFPARLSQPACVCVCTHAHTRTLWQHWDGKLSFVPSPPTHLVSMHSHEKPLLDPRVSNPARDDQNWEQSSVSCS